MEGIRDAADQSVQLQLGAPEHGWRDAEVAVDGLVQRFGRDSVLPARLLEPRVREEGRQMRLSP
jgi:DNA polymerase-4